MLYLDYTSMKGMRQNGIFKWLYFWKPKSSGMFLNPSESYQP